jgi:hypothetical protein
MDFLEDQALRQQALLRTNARGSADSGVEGVRLVSSIDTEAKQSTQTSSGALSKLIAAGKAKKKASPADDKLVAELAEFAGFRNDKPHAPEFEFDLESFHTLEQLLAADMDQLKSALQLRGMKCGGTREERAGRLFLARALPFGELRQKLEPKHFSKQKANGDSEGRQPKRKEQGPLPHGVQRLPNQKRIKTKNERRAKRPKQYGTQAVVGLDGIQIV